MAQAVGEPGTRLPRDSDVVIIGSGPAGLSAAAELRRLGVGSVLVLERESAAGGVPRHCGHSPYGLREFRRLMFGPAYAARLTAEARKLGAILHTGVTVTGLEPGPAVAVTSDAGSARVRARAVLLATGTRETTRAGRLIGGSKPGGVLVTGAVQNMIYAGAGNPFRAPVILGSELVAFSALLTCRHAGIRPVAMIEPDPRITARHPSQLLPRVLGIPLYLRSGIHRIIGRDRVEAVEVATPDGLRRLDADGVLVTGQFRPESTLARLAGVRIDPASHGPEVDQAGRCSLPGFYAAGNLLRPVETAGWCWQEGRAVARAIAEDLARTDTPPDTVPSVHIAQVSDPLKYAVPQRLSGVGPPALDRLQFRVARPASGRIGLRVDGHEVAGRSLSALPERRLLLPLPSPKGSLSVTFDEL